MLNSIAKKIKDSHDKGYKRINDIFINTLLWIFQHSCVQELSKMLVFSHTYKMLLPLSYILHVYEA